MKHTKGPWFVDKDYAKPQILIVSGNRTHISIVFDNPRHQKKANANLIAAAPGMLEALEMLSKALESKDFNPDAAKQLIDYHIKKTKGE